MGGLGYYIARKLFYPAVDSLLEDGADHLPRCQHLPPWAPGITCPICVKDLGIVCAVCFGPHPASHGAGCDYCGTVPRKGDHLFDALPFPLPKVAALAGRGAELDPNVRLILFAGVSLCRLCSSAFGVSALPSG